MPTRMRKPSKEADIDRSADTDSEEMSFDVLEWLESERLEHERRMQQLGCPSKSTEKLPESRDDHNLSKPRPSK
jgi:hypothetical protein